MQVKRVRRELDGGWIVPARWTQTDDEREALRVANGADLGKERATLAVLLLALALMVLLVVRVAV